MRFPHPFSPLIQCWQLADQNVPVLKCFISGSNIERITSVSPMSCFANGKFANLFKCQVSLLTSGVNGIMSILPRHQRTDLATVSCVSEVVVSETTCMRNDQLPIEQGGGSKILCFNNQDQACSLKHQKISVFMYMYSTCM